MATSKKTFEYTATGVLGDKRSAMLSNELHLRNRDACDGTSRLITLNKSQLARSKKHGYTSYPGETFRYGLPYPEKDYGVAETLQWNDGKSALEEKKTHPKAKTSKSTTAKSRPKTFSSNMVFGLPARPSTPINEVLEFKYQDDWIQNQRRIQDEKTRKNQAKKVTPGEFRENRTSDLRKSLLITEEEKPLWHMPKFDNAQRQVDTFRSETERERAYTQQQQQHHSMSMVECN